MKTCTQCSAEFQITDDDLKFYDQISPIFAGNKYTIPPPTICSDCRQQRRMAFRNERKFYRRKCDMCEKHMISVYSQQYPHEVYCKDCWWSDKWDASIAEKDFNFNKTFFEQFLELQNSVPRLALMNLFDENSDYTNYGYGNKDCYMLSTSDDNEKCYYGCFVWSSLVCVDCTFVIDCQYCYECIDSVNLYECSYCRECDTCQNCFDCYECKGCKDCFGCYGLIKEQYYFQNKKLSKQEYFKRLKELKYANISFVQIPNEFPRRSIFQVNCEGCTGDHLKNSKNSQWCFDGYGVQDSKWIANIPGDVKNCYDLDGAGGVEWSAECISTGRPANQCFACDHMWHGNSNEYYCSFCMKDKNCFGCIGLRHKQYCILNKQYTKQEYEELVPRIIEHMKSPAPDGTGVQWGEFFPISLSPFAYNETVAQEYFPLTQKQVEAKGWKWKQEIEADFSEVTKRLPAKKLPPNITDIPDDILNWAIECEHTKKLFKIQKAELAFYRKQHLPIPHLHPDERHKRRMNLRNPRTLYERTCNNCHTPIHTTYSPDRPETVYCEECYLKEVY